MKLLKKLNFSLILLAIMLTTGFLIPSCKSGETAEETTETAVEEETTEVAEIAPVAEEDTTDRGIKVVPPGG